MCVFLLHIGHIRDDVYHSSKKIQPGTILTSKCFTFGGKQSDNSNMEMNLKKTALIQFSMSENTLMIILYHSGHIRDDIWNTIKKIHSREKGMNFKSNFSEQFLSTPILKWT